jgi:hypothetical protein
VGLPWGPLLLRAPTPFLGGAGVHQVGMTSSGLQAWRAAAQVREVNRVGLESALGTSSLPSAWAIQADVNFDLRGNDLTRPRPARGRGYRLDSRFRAHRSVGPLGAPPCLI